MPGPRHALRCAFDAGSFTCLWAANDAARQAFDNAADLRALPLAADTLAWLERFEGSIDWDDPGGGGRWGAPKRDAFARAAAAGLARLRRELPAPDFLVHDAAAPASC